jgi:D-tyrosyl-tRNA(Tyr) deacylase
MISVVQRASQASVQVGEQIVGSIGPGLLALVAVCEDDTETDVQWTARKLVEMRIFRSGEKHFDLDVKQAGGSILLVSNCTVAAATRHGRRPSFDKAADAVKGEQLFSALVETLRDSGVPVQVGQFRADMQVHLVNDGPVTVLLNSAESRAS